MARYKVDVNLRLARCVLDGAVALHQARVDRGIMLTAFDLRPKVEDLKIEGVLHAVEPHDHLEAEADGRLFVYAWGHFTENPFSIDGADK